MNHPRAAFTLLEVLVVLTILAILLALGVPSYARWRASLTVQEAAQQFARDIDRTRTEAKRYNDTRTIAIPPEGGTSYTRSGSSILLPPGTRIALAPDFTNAAIAFFPPYGTADILAHQFEVSSTTYPSITRTVRVTSLFGQVVIK